MIHYTDSQIPQNHKERKLIISLELILSDYQYDYGHPGVPNSDYHIPSNNDRHDPYQPESPSPPSPVYVPHEHSSHIHSTQNPTISNNNHYVSYSSSPIDNVSKF